MPKLTPPPPGSTIGPSVGEALQRIAAHGESAASVFGIIRVISGMLINFNGDEWFIGFNKLRNNPTRGQVLDLLRALGVRTCP